MAVPTHLIVVCCHGIWTGGPNKGFDESEWLIADFQTGETPIFIEHIKAGLQCLHENDDAVLMYSGGPTRPETRLTEARSYVNLAQSNNYFGILPEDKAHRIHVEERALDSYYNVLFSKVQFWRTFGRWAERLTIVSHGFKKERIVDGHCAAIGYPLDRVTYVGIDPPGMRPDELNGGAEVNEAAIKGSAAAVGHWTEDPHGVGEILAGKRRRRNPWGVVQDLCLGEEEKERSGLGIVRVGEEESLDPEGRRPWVTVTGN